MFAWADRPLASGLTAIEVKSGRESDDDRHGLDELVRRCPEVRARLVGSGGISLADFLAEGAPE